MILTQDDTRTAFIKAFESSPGDLAQSVRQAAAQALERLEIPTRKWEAWKYTNLKPLVKRSYQAAPPVTLNEADIQPFLIPDFKGDRLVFVNGRFSSKLSQLGHNEGVLKVEPLSQLSGEGQAIVEAHMGSLIPGDENIFSALNTAYATEGTLLNLAPGKVAAAPIHVLHILSPEGATVQSQYRNLFRVGQNAEAVLVESVHTLGAGLSLSNVATEIFVGANASLEYVKLQQESDQAARIDRVQVEQADDSRFNIFTLTFSGDLVRNHLDIKLKGQNIATELMGLYLLSDQQHVDNYTRVDHAEPNGYSNELYKGIVTDQATGVFSGRIHVYPDAQKTNAYQSNRNILLSDTANIYTQPQLEIYADDVKCSHGATTGRLDEDAMFYLQARGIPELEARAMMVQAFAMETAEQISVDSVKAWVAKCIEARY